MGVDMYMYAERLVQESWQPVPEPEPDPWVEDDEEIEIIPVELGDIVCRHHRLYSLLAGTEIGGTCRNDEVPQIFTPRGLPKDMSKFYAALFQDWYETDRGDFGASWLMVHELVDLDLDSYEVFHYGYVEWSVAHLFTDGQPFPADFPKDARIYSLSDNPDYPVKVRWSIGTLCEYVDYSLQLLLNEDLLPLGPPDEVRIIYWFNW